jgi:adenine specific DNA methylase
MYEWIHQLASGRVKIESGRKGMPTLNWIGKDKVLNHHLEVPFHVLERQYSFDEAGKHEEDNGSENMIIHGDNLLALKSLLPKYEGKIKCIYIDPPYNTGNENWVYNDNVNDPHIQRWLHQVVGKEGEDLSRHDKWLCMMYPRLQLLQRLLAEDGVIFISIDDNEQANLKLICDEIFGAGNFVTNLIWEKKFSRANDAKYFSEQHDHILIYAKQKNLFFLNKLPVEEEQTSRYKNPDNDPRGAWQSIAYNCNKNADERPNLYYPVINPNTGKEIWPDRTRVWSYTKDRHEENVANNLVYWGADGRGKPRFKKFLDTQSGLVPMTIWKTDFAGDNQFSRKEYRAIFGTDAFDFSTPKPTKLIQRILQIATNKDSIILDSFAGSGTTAHAVLNMNRADGGNRKFICVEMMDYADTITAERVKRVINGYGEGKKTVDGTGGSFSYYELGEPLLVDDKLNNVVSTEKIREYIYYMETKQALPEASADEPMLLGVYHGAAYYFNYEKDASTTLNAAFLKSIKTQAEAYVIYADTCVLSENKLQQFHITFKKIPRDIARL